MYSFSTQKFNWVYFLLTKVTLVPMHIRHQSIPTDLSIGTLWGPSENAAMPHAHWGEPVSQRSDIEDCYVYICAKLFYTCTCTGDEVELCSNKLLLIQCDADSLIQIRTANYGYNKLHSPKCHFLPFECREDTTAEVGDCHQNTVKINHFASRLSTHPCFDDNSDYHHLLEYSLR